MTSTPSQLVAQLAREHDTHRRQVALVRASLVRHPTGPKTRGKRR